MTPIDKQLQKAIEENDAVAVQTLVAKKPQRLEQRDNYGQTVLIVAVLAQSRSLDCIKALLDAGAEVNGRNRGGFTALHVVIWNEYFPPESASSEDIIDLLLDAGAELEDKQNDYACTPLMCAVMENCCSDARLLLSRGANPNQVLSDNTVLTSDAGWSLLSWAWLKPEMMQVLIDGGADVSLRDAFSQTALEWIERQDAGDFEAEKQKSLEMLRKTQRR